MCNSTDSSLMSDVASEGNENIRRWSIAEAEKDFAMIWKLIIILELQG